MNGVADNLQEETSSLVEGNYQRALVESDQSLLVGQTYINTDWLDEGVRPKRSDRTAKDPALFESPYYWDLPTGARNRIFFDEHLRDLFLIDSASGRTTSVVCCELTNPEAEIDPGFHNINDAFLENVALVMESQTCGNDQVVRFGDSTFTAILPETDAETAKLIALSLTEALAALQAAWMSSEKELVSFSLGTATNDQETRYNCLDSLCHAADRNRQHKIETV